MNPTLSLFTLFFILFPTLFNVGKPGDFNKSTTKSQVVELSDLHINPNSSGRIWVFQDQQPQGTVSGQMTSTDSTWITRKLNTVVYSDGADVSLSSNQITIGTGVYKINVSVPAYKVEEHQARLFNHTTNQVEAYGTSQYAFEDITSISQITKIVQVASVQTYSIQHKLKGSNEFGLGYPCNFGTEVYTVVEIERFE